MSVTISTDSTQIARDLIYANYEYTGREAKALDRCLSLTRHLWIGYSNEEPVCAWGLIPPTLLSDSAYLWMITLGSVEGYEFVLVRHSQIQIARMLEAYPKIVGHCEASETRSIRWLRWLGATFGEPQGSFVPFTIRRKA